MHALHAYVGWKITLSHSRDRWDLKTVSGGVSQATAALSFHATGGVLHVPDLRDQGLELDISAYVMSGSAQDLFIVMWNIL